MIHENIGNTVRDNTPPNESQTDKSAEVQTSSHPRTVINYKQFLEEYVDAPTTPPRKKCEVDLKCKPSKQRIAADKFRFKFITKPMHLLRPVRNKNAKKNLEAAPKPAMDTQPSTSGTSVPKSNTVLTQATSMETREAIEALLMLGDMPTVENNPLPADDNALLVPITGPAPDEIQDALLAMNVTEPHQLTKELSHWYTHQEVPHQGW